MRKILLSIFLILIFLCSTAMGETAADWHYKAHALWDGEKYTDPKKAIEYLSNAIKLLPDDAKAYSDRGNAYNKLGQHQRAIEDFDKAISLKQDDADLYYNRGIAYDNLSQYQPAIEDYNKAIRLKTDYTDAYNNRGIAYLSQGNNELGCPDAQKACELGNCKLLEFAKGKGDCH